MKKGMLLGGMAILTLSLSMMGCVNKERPANKEQEIEDVETPEEEEA